MTKSIIVKYNKHTIINTIQCIQKETIQIQDCVVNTRFVQSISAL